MFARFWCAMSDNGPGLEAVPCAITALFIFISANTPSKIDHSSQPSTIAQGTARYAVMLPLDHIDPNVSHRANPPISMQSFPRSAYGCMPTPNSVVCLCTQHWCLYCALFPLFLDAAEPGSSGSLASPGHERRHEEQMADQGCPGHRTVGKCEKHHQQNRNINLRARTDSRGRWVAAVACLTLASGS